MRSLALTPPLLWIHVGSRVAKMKRLNKGFEPQLKRNTSYQLIIMDMDKKIRIAQLRAELSILEEVTEAPEVSAQGRHTGTVSSDAWNTNTTPTATPKTTTKPHSQQKKLVNEIPEVLYKSTFMKIALAIHENNQIAKNGKKKSNGTSW